MEEQHIFGEFGYFQVLYHKYQPTKSGSKAPPPHPAQKRAISFGHRTKESNMEDF